MSTIVRKSRRARVRMDRAGYTLVELLVTFALISAVVLGIGIFCTLCYIAFHFLAMVW